MKVKDITANRTIEKRKCYFIETQDDYYIIKGSFIRKTNGQVVDAYFAFINDQVDWPYVERRINLDYDTETEYWKHLSDFGYETDIPAIEVYSNGIKIN